MLAPEDKSCGQCGRSVGAGTHLRWYLSSAATGAVLAAIVGHSLINQPIEHLIYTAGVGALIGAGGAWSLRRSRMAG
jgi:hypothetical protein